MKLIKKANKNTIKLSKSEWEAIGQRSGWLNKKAEQEYDKYRYEEERDDELDVKLLADDLKENEDSSLVNHKLWNSLSEEEQNDMLKEKEYAPEHCGGGGPYICLYIAKKHGAEVDLVDFTETYSDGGCRTWQDKNTGEIFWDYMEG